MEAGEIRAFSIYPAEQTALDSVSVWITRILSIQIWILLRVVRY